MVYVTASALKLNTRFVAVNAGDTVDAVIFQPDAVRNQLRTRFRRHQSQAQVGQSVNRVPLADRTVEILEEMTEVRDGSGLVFPSATGKVLSDNTLSKMLRDLGVPAVPHGFRSGFRDWCSEYAQVPREVAEAALAHVVKDSTEAAYARSTMFEGRAALMQGWADYLNQARDSAGGTLGGTKANLFKKFHIEPLIRSNSGGRGRSRTHQTRLRVSTALKAARPTGGDALPRSV